MLARLTLDPDGLARLRVRTHADGKAFRPFRYRLDSDGLGLAVALPGPAYLAPFLSLDGLDAYRSGAALLARPTGSEDDPEPLTLSALAEALRQALSALPPRPDAGDAYRDLRLAVGVPSPMFDAYLGDVLRQYRKTLPAVPSRPKATRRPAGRSSTERSRDARTRRREEERSSAAWGLAMFLSDDEDRTPPAPGSRVSGSKVFEYVSDVLAGAVDDFEAVVVSPRFGSQEHRMTREKRLDVWDEERECYTLPPPRRPRSVSRRVLFEVAEAHGFTTTRPSGSVALRLPEEAHMTATTELLIERAARLLADASRASARPSRPRWSSDGCPGTRRAWPSARRRGGREPRRDRRGHGPA